MSKSTDKLSQERYDNPFPNENVSPAKKALKAFGLRVARAILARHNYYNNQTNRIHKIHENRRYASGRQDVDKYKPRLDAYIDSENANSHINIDWSIHSVGPKMIEVVVGGMLNQDHKIQLNSLDPQSKTTKAKQRDKFFENIIKKNEIKELEEMAGTPLVDFDDSAPQTSDEIDIYMEMEYRQPIEIAMEEIVDFEMYNNDWDNIRERIIRDIVENNKGAARVYWDENNNIRIRYVDIADLIHSYTEDPRYGDTEYEAELNLITIRELRKRAKGSLTEEELFGIGKKSAGKYDNGKWIYGNRFNNTGTFNKLDYAYDDFRVQVLDFVFYTTDVYKWETKENKYGGFYFGRKEFDYTSPERSKYERELIMKEVESSYEGLWVVDTEHIVDYHRSRNMLRETANMNKITPKILHPYVIIEPNSRAGTSNSLMDKMKPSLDAMQLYVLKMRHIVAEAAPPGAYIDVSALNNLQLGTKDLDPSRALQLWKQKGILLYNGENDNGDPMNRKPVENAINGIGAALDPLIQAWSFEMETIRSITGINEARDGSQPDSKALVGIEKMKLLASNNATRSIYNAFLDGILQPLGFRLTRMVQDKMVFGDGLKQYENIIGKQGVKSLEFLPKDFSLLELGIKVESLPTDEDIERLSIDIQKSLDSKEIRLEDAVEVRNIMNVKKAYRYLIHRRKKYQKEALEEFERKEAITAQREAAAAQASAEAEAIKEQAKTQRETSVLQIKYDLEMQLSDRNTENKLKEIDREGYWKERHIEEAESKGDTGIDANNDGEGGGGTGMGVPKAHTGPRVLTHPVESASRTS